jgi:hypothetical protein
MVKRRSNTVSLQVDRLFLPGINITELLEFEEIFPDLRRYIATIMFPVVTVAQIRIALATSKPTVVQNLESTNTYYRSILSKSYPLVYVSAAVAIRRTAIVYANDTDSNRIVEDHTDLSTILSGPITTRGGVTSALGDPQRLRAYRRGLMAQVTGQLQSVPLHSPRRLCRDVEAITADDFLSRLPFETQDLKIDDIVNDVSTLIGADSGPVDFVDSPAVPEGVTALENSLGISRIAPAIPDISKAPADISSLPAWKRAAIRQVRNIEGGLA